LEEEEETPRQTLRRSTWKRRKPYRYNYRLSYFVCILSLFPITDEPIKMKEAMEIEDKESYILFMDEEILSLRKNDTWDLIPFLNKQKLIG
jgi:hypothetical protein